MGTPNKNSGSQHDGQKNYQHSNQRNPDNIRNATRDHEYKEHEETLTNDANYDTDSHEVKGNMDFNDKNENADKHQSEE